MDSPVPQFQAVHQTFPRWPVSNGFDVRYFVKEGELLVCECSNITQLNRVAEALNNAVRAAVAEPGGKAEMGVTDIMVCKLPYQDHWFVHGARAGTDVWLRRDGSWSTEDCDPQCALPANPHLVSDATLRTLAGELCEAVRVWQQRTYGFSPTAPQPLAGSIEGMMLLAAARLSDHLGEKASETKGDKRCQPGVPCEECDNDAAQAAAILAPQPEAATGERPTTRSILEAAKDALVNIADYDNAARIQCIARGEPVPHPLSIPSPPTVETAEGWRSKCRVGNSGTPTNPAWYVWADSWWLTPARGWMESAQWYPLADTESYFPSQSAARAALAKAAPPPGVRCAIVLREAIERARP